MEKTQNNLNPIAIAIVIAGLIIAGAIFMTRGGSGGTVASNNNDNADDTASASSIEDFRLPDENSHVKGNPEAKATIVEFSDFECPFCSRIHPTLSQIVEERDDVNWVYRHFPLSQIHSNALSSAVASECVAKLAGNDAFWTFSDAIFANQQSLGQSLYNSEASKLGISEGDLESCMADTEIVKIVRDDSAEAVASGGRGTPFSVLITPEGELVPFSGALPYESIVALLEKHLGN